MNITGTVDRPLKVSATEAPPLSSMEIGLRLLLTSEQETTILANPKHAAVLESLFHSEHGALSMEYARRKDPSQDPQVLIKADPAKPLPPHYASLICAIAHVAPTLAAKMLCAPLLCQTEPNVKAGLALTCASLWKEADLPAPAQVLGKTDGAALQKEMLALLAGDKFAVELKQFWAPLVDHEVAQAPSHQADGSTSGQPMGSGNTVHGLTGQFYAALIHGDTVGMEIALQELSQLGDAGAPEAYRNCHLDMMQVAPLPVPQIPLSEPSASPLRDGITITSPTTETEPAPPAMREEVPFTQQEFAMVVPGSAASLELQKQNAEGPEKLAEAITSGNLEQMEKLLGESGALLINAKMPPTGFTPVGLAAVRGNKEAVAFLLKCPGVDVNQCSLLAPTVRSANAAARRGIVADASPLILGMKSGNMEVVELLLAAPGIDLNAVNRYGQTPLCQAARMGNVELVAHLLQQPQVDATLADVYGLTPLHAAAANLEQPTLVQAFLAFREDEFDSLANIPDPRGNKALDYAKAVGNDPTDVIGSLEIFTEPSSVHAAPSILTDYTQSFLLVGPEVPRFPLGNFQEVAASGGVSLSHLGDGGKGISWDELENFEVQPGASTIVMCHGTWDEASQTHSLLLNSSGLVPTEDIVQLLYEKGVRKMTFFGCEIGRGVEGIAQSISCGVGWPRPLDPELEITFVGGDRDIGTAGVVDDASNRLADFGAKRAGKEGSSMDRLTVSSKKTLTWSDAEGTVVVQHQGPPKAGERGDLTPEQERRVQGNALVKRAGHGHADKVAEMVGQPGVDVNFTDSLGYFPLFAAASSGRTEAVQFLLTCEGIDVNKALPSGKTVLLEAMEKGHLEVVKLLLGAPLLEVNQADSTGLTPLVLAAATWNNAMVMELVQHGGINLDVPFNDLPAVYHAAIAGNREVVALLIEIGANLYDPSESLLQAIAERGHGEIAAMIAEAAAKRRPEVQLP